MLRRILPIGALAALSVVPLASAAPTKPVGSETAVVHQVCNHFTFYRDGFLHMANVALAHGDMQAYKMYMSYYRWTLAVHAAYC